jgi:hypothetical protein
MQLWSLSRKKIVKKRELAFRWKISATSLSLMAYLFAFEGDGAPALEFLDRWSHQW